MLSRCANGFGAMALAALSQSRAFGASPMSPRPAHFRPRAKNVIFLYMDGGPAQMDTFDPKPRLNKEHGEPFKMKMEPTQFNNNGNTFGSPWAFRPGGKCGTPVSDLFPFVRELADDLCVVRSMTSNFSEHTSANYFLHTGNGQQGRPSMGAWVSYGLGSVNQNLPGFVVLNGGLIPPGGVDNFANGFLPATFQGSIFKPADQPVANIAPREKRAMAQRDKLNLVAQLDGNLLDRQGHADAVESAIGNYELAFQMQSAVPELMDLSGESEATKRLYGLDAPYEKTRIYARQCLLARRMIERGVRFVELTCPSIPPNDRWDQHGKLKKGHTENALAVDQPIAGLLRDLKGRGMLEETLVLWAGEFGRTPFSQGSDGRDHDPYAYSLWMAGGGAKGGTIYGTTDEYGYKVVESRMEMYDLHATILQLLGVDHKRLTFRWGGRDMRLTDVHGEVIDALIA
ncbi:MAG TPA: DUF1501 domain-containing protein [Humisphaera sp.]|jgi:hypothetical protein|nr:DUF1501 domain-containing protein [Humisphaera sp.]